MSRKYGQGSSRAVCFSSQLRVSRVGFFGVLHTWGRTLEYHPHVHYVVPGGAVSEDGSKWLPSRVDFFLPVKGA